MLFSIYDQIIDDYLLPNEIYTFNVLLDEVWAQYGVDPKDPYTLKHAWCQCPKCRKKERSELSIEHSIKVLKHLKEKGMKSVVIAHDMLAGKQSKLGYVADKFMARILEEDLRDVPVLDWWWYSDAREILGFHVMPDELGLRSGIPHIGTGVGVGGGDHDVIAGDAGSLGNDLAGIRRHALHGVAQVQSDQQQGLILTVGNGDTSGKQSVQNIIGRCPYRPVR